MKNLYEILINIFKAGFFLLLLTSCQEKQLKENYEEEISIEESSSEHFYHEKTNTNFRNCNELLQYARGKSYSELKEKWGKGSIGEEWNSYANTVNPLRVSVQWNNIKCNGNPVEITFEYSITPTSFVGIDCSLFEIKNESFESENLIEVKKKCSLCGGRGRIPTYSGMTCTFSHFEMGDCGGHKSGYNCTAVGSKICTCCNGENSQSLENENKKSESYTPNNQPTLIYHVWDEGTNGGGTPIAKYYNGIYSFPDEREHQVGDVLYILNNGRKTDPVKITSIDIIEDYRLNLKLGGQIKSSLATNNPNIGLVPLPITTNRPKEFDTPLEDYSNFFKLLSKIDIDLDGEPELIYERVYYESFDYEIYKKNGNKWLLVFDTNDKK